MQRKQRDQDARGPSRSLVGLLSAPAIFGGLVFEGALVVLARLLRPPRGPGTGSR